MIKKISSVLLFITCCFSIQSASAGFLDSLFGEAQMSDVYVAPDFEDIHSPNSKIVVLGVVSQLDSMPVSQQLAWGDMVVKNVQRKNRKLVIEGPRPIQNALGRETVLPMLEFYKATGHLDLTHLSIIEEKYPSASHILVVRIDRDDINYNKTRSEYMDKKKPKVKAHYNKDGSLKIDSFKMKSQKFTAYDIYTTSRNMGITIEIFDMKQGVTVYSAYVHKRGSTTNTNTSTYSSNPKKRAKEEITRAITEGILSNVRDREINKYPQPIDSRKLFKDLVVRFARKIP